MVEQENLGGGSVNTSVSEPVEFVLNTKRTCFLCLKKVSFSRQNGSIEIGGTKCCLSSISRYLNIKFLEQLVKNELVGASRSQIAKFLEELQEGEEGDEGESSSFAVKLCEECCQVVDKLSDMCLKLKLIQLKVKRCLRKFYEVLEASFEETGANNGEQIIDLVQDIDVDGTYHEKLAEIIRKKLKDKCYQKLNPASPEVLSTNNTADSLKTEVESADDSPQIVSTFTQSAPEMPQFSIQQLTPVSTSTTATTTVLLPTTPIFFFDNTTPTMHFLEPTHDVISTNTSATQPTEFSDTPVPRKVFGRTFKCTNCSETFSNRNSLLRHRRYVHSHQTEQEQMERNCSLCNLKFRYNSDFIAHIKYECQYLGDVNSGELNASSSEGSKKKFICRLCNPHLTMGTRRGLKEHTIRNHVETLMTAYKLPHLSMREFKEYCDHTFQVEILSSVKGHNAEGNPCVQCAYCSNSYSNHYTLRQHFYIVHEEIMSKKLTDLQKTSTLEEIMAIDLPTFSFPENERWTCVACGATFAQDTSLYKHRRHICKYRHENKSQMDNDSTCEICGKVCAGAQSKVVHKRKAHGNAPPIGTSSQIQEVFGGGKTGVNKYIPTVSTEENSDVEEVFEEDDVSMAMILESNLHSNSADADDDKLYTCTLCNPSCHIQEKDIKRHKIDNHVETLFDSTCKLQNVSMTDLKVYASHVLKMEILSSKKEYNEFGNAIFYCSHCSKRYASQTGLNLHIFSEHKPVLSAKLVELQRRYSVTQIKDMDKTASSFEKEKDIVLQKQKLDKVLSGGYPKHNNCIWKCDICGRRFNHRGSLWTHKKRIHSSSIQVTSTRTLTNKTTEKNAFGEVEVHHYSLQLSNNDGAHDFEESEQNDQSVNSSPQEYFLIDEDEHSSTMHSENSSENNDIVEMSMMESVVCDPLEIS